MTKRILLAGLLGGLAIYIWTALAHMVLQLGETGIKEIPNEAPVLSAMRNVARRHFRPLSFSRHGTWAKRHLRSEEGGYATFGARFRFVVLLGVVALIGTNVSYRNWYRFPLGYTSAYIATQVLGFVWVGPIAAAMVKLSGASRPS